ncbi:thiamine pyrophosphokinase [Trypanosoma melophagium]|uniref:thiamine pyrophosphokinase n=1 Tax=Trypanosoma melophagium TaxID=715481 RepID=UPI00351A4324|nr:thiamine pyrophosphokinase [Trypanosoma melophagium]
MPRAVRTVVRKVVQHDFYDTAEQVSGVVLLNSPSNARWEYDEYLRLLIVKRFSHRWERSQPTGQCYFVCADGAYPRLRAYVDGQQQQQPHLRLFRLFPLCDAVIGDMDSYTTVRDEDNVETPVSAPTDGYATVEEIPSTVLDAIYERARSAVTEFLTLGEDVTRASLSDWEKILGKRRGEPSLTPLRLHVRCQMSTDFMKALILIGRLREHHSHDAVVPLPPALRLPDGLKLLQTGGSIDPNAGNKGSDIDIHRESKMCAEASLVEALKLPTYIAIGALGGRFDHEMGSISAVLSFSRVAHVVITDSNNTIFACQPNGWTQVVRQPKHEGVMCGLLNYGTLRECETSGLLWNVVIGRGKRSETEDLVLSFDKFISVCNVFRHEVVTIDLRSLCHGRQNRGSSSTTIEDDKTTIGTEEDSPPTLFSIQRYNSNSVKRI